MEIRNHFLLIKKSGFRSDRRSVSARVSTDLLIQAGIWPLWKNSPCKYMIQPGNKILFYLAGEEAGCKCVIASAVVDTVVDWTDKVFKKTYPLLLDGEPEKVIRLKETQYFEKPIFLLSVLDHLSFVPVNRKKWGVAMMGGVRSLAESDFKVLSGGHSSSD